MIIAVPTDGRCGEPAAVLLQHGTVPNPGWSTYCELPQGHAGWHRDDIGTEWTALTEWAAKADTGTRSLDAAMHTVWLHGDWRRLTERMTTEQREAAADAVDRYRAVLDGEELAGPVGPSHLRWWR